jgi:hypothetical protein
VIGSRPGPSSMLPLQTLRRAVTHPTRWLPAVALLLYVAAFTWLRLADPTVPVPTVGSDTHSYFFPSFAFMRDSLLRGELPLWGPYQLAGRPFVALVTTAVFYPPLTVLFALEPATALAVHAISHLFLAGLFTYLFARRIGLGVAGALSAGVVFMGSSHIAQAACQNTVYLSTLVWLPAVFYAIRRAVDEPGFQATCLLA